MAKQRFTRGSRAYPFPPSPGFPGSERLASRLDDAASRLYEKLMSVDLQALDVSDYFSKYLRTHLKNALPSLQLNSHLLFLSLRGIVEGNDIGIVDYGGGSGLLSLLAREAGVANVIYNDIYDVACMDARTLAVSVGLEADDYVLGDIEELSSYLRGHAVRCRSIVSSDVIEHVYDVNTFLQAVPGISSGPLRVVFASHANTFNPLLRWMLMRAQRAAESVDRPPEVGHKLRDTTRSYRRVREEMIQQHAPTLTFESVVHLGAVTRGLMKADIESAVDRFLESGESPAKLVHPTNTCDPYTGNWCEHLMDPIELAKTLSASGVPTRVRVGYWGDYADRWKRLSLPFVNMAIRMSGAQGRRLAPCYVLYGDRP
jgi:2-polyprenyl-3-methyl-5-hydroxy-6-metoxy-1,4-benzoquinol methylase